MTKTEFMLIGSRQKLNTLTEPHHLLINDTPVKQFTMHYNFWSNSC